MASFRTQWYDEMIADAMWQHESANADSKILARAVMTAGAFIADSLDTTNERLYRLTEILESVEGTASAIREAFISSSLVDMNSEPANITDAIDGAVSKLSLAIREARHDAPGSTIGGKMADDTPNGS